jgi:hypothetical protein
VSTDTGATVFDGPIRARKFGKIVSSHLGLDLHRVEHLPTKIITRAFLTGSQPTHLAIVYSNNTTNHFRNYNHITEMGFDDCRLLIGWCLLLGLAQFLYEAHWSAFETALEPTAGTSMNELY